MFLLLAACGGPDDTDTPSGNDDVAVCAAENGPFSADVTHPYTPFVIGAHHVIEGEEGGEGFGHFETWVLDETAEVNGVTTRVVEHQAQEEGVVVEISRYYFAQAPDQTVCFFGEDIDEMEGTEVVGHEGSWHAGEEGAEAAIQLPGDPTVGDLWTMVYVPPDEVETAEITGMGESVETPAGTFTDTLTVLEEGPSLKYYARDIGQIYDDGMALVSY